MNPVFLVFFALFLLLILFFSIYSIFKLVFLSLSSGISLSSSPPGIGYPAYELAYLAIFAGIISVVIIILGVAWMMYKSPARIKKG